MATPTPLFVLSLPRSGSTLAQRILATHPEISTRSEPWLLLPLLYALREEVFAEYDHAFARYALEEFLGTIPGGREVYRGAVRAFATDLYARASEPGARYFLDKTPRYALVADELVRTFPDAPIIVLWRNPLAIAASLVETWGGGRWSVYKNKVDLHLGLERLLALQRDHPARVLAVRYEDLLTAPEASWARVFKYLGLHFDPSIVERFQITILTGAMGDPTGTKHYRSLSTEPLEKWKRTFGSPLRRRWAARYLDWIGSERLAEMGYSIDFLRSELAQVPPNLRSLPSDAWYSLYGVFHHLLELKQVRLKLQQLPRWSRIRAHR